MSEQLFHVGVKALVRDDRGRVLLVGNCSHDGKQRYMDLPGGRMDAGEGFLDTLKRELHEEIGISYTGIPEYFDTVLSNVQPHTESGQVGLVLLVYHTKLPESGVLKLGEQEHVYKWCEPTEAADLLQFKYPADFCESVKGM